MTNDVKTDVTSVRRDVSRVLLCRRRHRFPPVPICATAAATESDDTDDDDDDDVDDAGEQ